jgi:outer membrane protein OmpA-like peptidoglycan-associated protein
VRRGVVAIALVASTAAAQTPIHVTYDEAHLDLDKRELQFKVSRPIASAELVVIGDDGAQLAKASAAFDDSQPRNGWLAITWQQPDATTVLELDLRVVGKDNVATRVQLIPWSVTIAHEDVNFATDSSTIEASEQQKLDASLAKINDVVTRTGKFVHMKLYVAGHTDTVGSAAHNHTLSLSRARAIAGYFRAKGLALPIAYAGYGEDVLKVKTADNTDEPLNRRADYVIGPADAPPPFRGPYLKAHAEWKMVK